MLWSVLGGNAFSLVCYLHDMLIRVVNIGRMSITGLDLEAAETDDTETAN